MKTFQNLLIRRGWVTGLLAGIAMVAQRASATDSDVFEKKIRPVLTEKCYECHSAKSEKIKGGLTLDTREGIRRGGDTGPAVVPGDLNKSLLLAAIRYTNSDFAMPPKKAGGKLPDAVIHGFEEWVKMGAPDPREGSAAVAKKYDTSGAKNWWSYQPLQKAAVPATRDKIWAKTDIDRFVLAGLEAKGLKPVAEADRNTLLRRLYFDLIGLPPSPEQTSAFLRDTDPKAWEKAVDKLLASLQFGERWGRHWLDVSRYAESSGKDVNLTFPNAWRYRDYVVASFNQDKPYDHFLQEQIAGDLLPSRTAAERAEHLIATGFLAIGAKSLNEMNPRQFAVDLADEQVDSVSQATLGLTAGCARCHDHKFDPISQKDYTALAGIFLSTSTRYGTAGGVQGRNLGSLIELPADAALPVAAKPMTPDQRREKEKRYEELITEQRQILAERAPGNANRKQSSTSAKSAFDVVRVFTQKAQLETELAGYDDNGRPKTLAMGVSEKPLTAPFRPTRGGFGAAPGPGGGGGPGRRGSGFEAIGNSPLFSRGDINKAGESVPRGMPALLASAPPPEIPRGSSGRLELAQWITSPQNPLMPRVMVNRVWYWIFGRGLVSSLDNFGTTGDKPTHPELLDYLAGRFEAEGWSVKKLIREIALSRVYQLAGEYNEAGFAADPDNTLLWRRSPRRLDAEAIRDAMLFAAGALDLKPQPGSLIASAGDGPIGGPRFMAVTEERVAGADSDARSIYLPLARNVPPEVLAVFDFPDGAAVQGAREVTSVPTQSLFLMNSDFAAKQSHRLAERVMTVYPDGPQDMFEKRFNLACLLVFNRMPDAAEQEAAHALAKRYPDDSYSAWTSISRSLFASASFRYMN